MDVAKDIKKLLVEKDMSLSDLARAIGVTPQNMSAKFRKNDFRISELQAISKVIGYNVSIVFTEKE